MIIMDVILLEVLAFCGHGIIRQHIAICITGFHEIPALLLTVLVLILLMTENSDADEDETLQLNEIKSTRLGFLVSMCVFS